jgi:hypothetical protein
MPHIFTDLKEKFARRLVKLFEQITTAASANNS